MTQLSNLIHPTVVAKMQQVATQPKREQAQVPICTCKATDVRKDGFTRLPGTNKVLMVHAGCMLPSAGQAKMFGDAFAEALDAAGLIDLNETVTAVLEPEAPAKRVLTEADAIDIDPESEAMIEAACVDCTTPLLIDPTPVEGHEDEPRVPICLSCAKDRALEAAKKQRAIQVIRKPQIAKHKPRVSDGIDHPVIVTTNTKESTMPEFDLSTKSPAELSALVAEATARLEANREEEVRKASKQAKKERKAAEKEAKKALKAEQKQRQAGVPLPEFTIKGVTVPALDLSEVDLNTRVSGVERSPYNKVRFRLLSEPALPHGIEPEEPTTTYADLAVEHLRLMEAAKAEAAKPKPEKAKGKGKKAEPQVIVADLDPKVAAIMRVRNCTQQEAERIAALVL